MLFSKALGLGPGTPITLLTALPVSVPSVIKWPIILSGGLLAVLPLTTILAPVLTIMLIRLAMASSGIPIVAMILPTIVVVEAAVVLGSTPIPEVSLLLPLVTLRPAVQNQT